MRLCRDFFGGSESEVGVGVGLQSQHVAVAAGLVQQRVVIADLDDAALLNHDNFIGVSDGTESVSDHEGGASAEEFGEALLDQAFAVAVEVGGGFVEDQDFGVGEDRAGDGDALTLAAGEFEAAFADQGVEAVGE